jgi:geranylgeranyl diphosphate synthase type II
MLGKTAGKDAAAQKATYPALIGVEETRRFAERLRMTAREALRPLDRNVSLLDGLLEQVANRTT